MPSSPQPVSPRWKGLLAALSLALAGFIWLSGLMDSLSRPSVAPALSLQQQELTFLAEPAVPPPLRDAFLGESPRDALLKALERISPEERNERQQQMLLLLQGQVPHPRSSIAKTTTRCSSSCIAKPAPLIRRSVSMLQPRGKRHSVWPSARCCPW